MSDAQIARRRGISRDAVKFHVANALAKVGLAKRADLRLWRGAPKDSLLRKQEKQMSAAVRLGPIGQISRTVRSIEEAQRWYGETLGLPHLFTFGKLAFFDCAGTRLYLTEEAGTAGPESTLYLKVNDIEEAYADLSARGVEFTNAPHLIFRHPNGTEEWMAFFKDPEGRLLALMAQIAP